MAQLTADDILAMAEENGMVNPRVIIRKQNNGRIALVLKHGPDAAREEIIFDRSLAAEAQLRSRVRNSPQ